MTGRIYEFSERNMSAGPMQHFVQRSWKQEEGMAEAKSVNYSRCIWHWGMMQVFLGRPPCFPLRSPVSCLHIGMPSHLRCLRIPFPALQVLQALQEGQMRHWQPCLGVFDDQRLEQLCLGNWIKPIMSGKCNAAWSHNPHLLWRWWSS